MEEANNEEYFRAALFEEKVGSKKSKTRERKWLSERRYIKHWKDEDGDSMKTS